MVHQKNVLTTLGCSSSLLLALAVTQPATAVPSVENVMQADQGVPTLVAEQKGTLDDLLGCTCPTCSASTPIETVL
ncbi:hypothetical protein [Acaryochloris thomasi]|uniref:hypothetical protein n=1 Tax=Acaryochloris thomasi TaxID=2929456 RepID=UPI0011B4D9D7|nr:hypothetical protein [Acaryochloris thomasi]